MTKYKVKESFFNNKNKGLLNNLNIKYISQDHYLAIILVYFFKVFTHDIFILGVLGLLIYFFINSFKRK